MSLESIFAAASQKPQTERDAYLIQACGDDAQLRRQVDRLLAAHDAAGDFLEAPAPGATQDYTPTTNEPGQTIGPYKLLQLLGEGGMGTVWVAEQEQPVKRRVALKLIKAGMDSAQVLRRFEAERQALALMDHTNIAKVLDAGTTPQGRPYFAMELVKGVPITKYCDELHLSLRERLDLFVPVCRAIQHAHQKGIIHRDIKPSNVLVAVQDGKPVPKVIDFGVAKAMQQRLTDQSMYTEIGAVIGTLEYMSPEQAELSALDIDTRTDVYALGVLLYELLTGSTPLDRKRLKEAAFAEMLRIIKEVEPPKPSTRLTDSKDSLASLAAQRRTEPAKLTKAMRGELDWIVMKCLEKDRTRRYETANGLARDIERHLNDEAVEACPPSASYRLRKFASKNRAALTTAAAIALLLIAGVAVSTWQAVRATRAEQVAIQARQAEAERAEGERVAKEAAQAREAETKAVLEFVENRVFAAARPKDQEGGQGYEVKLADAISASLPYVEKSFTDQPLIEARLRMTLGMSFAYLGKADIAEQQCRRARELYIAKLGPEHLYTIMSMNNLANCYAALGRHAEALALREEMLKLRKAKLGPHHPDTLKSMNNLANSYAALRRHAEALALRDETLKLRKAKLGPDHPDTLKSMNNLANSYAALGRHAEALALRDETLTLMKAKFGPDHPETLTGMNNLAASYYSLGNYPEVLALGNETLKLRKAKLGVNHPQTVATIYDIACTHALMIASTEDRGKQADLSMDWLQQAVAAGFKDAARMKKDTELDPLRDREDFKKLLAELEKKQEVKSP